MCVEEAQTPRERGLLVAFAWASAISEPVRFCYDPWMAQLPTPLVLAVAVSVVTVIVAVALLVRRRARRARELEQANVEPDLAQAYAAFESLRPVMQPQPAGQSVRPEGESVRPKATLSVVAESEPPPAPSLEIVDDEQRMTEPVSVHEKPTREFTAAFDPELAARHDPFAQLDVHNTPTHEFPAYREPDEETTAPGTATMEAFAATAFHAEETPDEGDQTSIFQPDAGLIDSLRELASTSSEPTAKVRTARASQPSEPPRSGLTAAAPLSTPSARPATPSQAARARIQGSSFYIHSSVNSEERVSMKRVSLPAPPAHNDVRTSGYAPTNAPRKDGRPVPDDAAKGRRSGR
jgi:hypothetical protein